MEINIIEKDVCAVIELEGSLTIHTSVMLKTESQKLLKFYNNIIIDFSGVDFIDSSGIGALALIDKKVKKQNGRMLVTNINEGVSLVFSVTRAFDIFDLYDSTLNAECSIVG